MTLAELNTLLATTNLPVAYLAFPAFQAPEMPFIMYQETGSDNFGADNIVWHSAMRIQIDLMTHKKNREIEELLESTLTGAGIYWERESSYDDAEDYYRVTYDIEI